MSDLYPTCGNRLSSARTITQLRPSLAAIFSLFLNRGPFVVVATCDVSLCLTYVLALLAQLTYVQRPFAQSIGERERPFSSLPPSEQSERTELASVYASYATAEEASPVAPIGGESNPKWRLLFIRFPRRNCALSPEVKARPGYRSRRGAA